MDIMGRFSNPSLIRVMEDLLGASRRPDPWSRRGFELSRNFGTRRADRARCRFDREREGRSRAMRVRRRPPAARA